MEQENMGTNRPLRHRRRKRSKLEIFKEAYLPAIIVFAAFLMILIFIIGSISHAVQRGKLERARQEELAQQQLEAEQQLRAQADAAIIDADQLATQYKYDEAIALLDALPEAVRSNQNVSEKRAELVSKKQSLVLWEDNSQVLNLSFHLLVADPQRAFNDAEMGASHKYNFITTAEFTKILQQLYENGYMLISMRDIIDVTTTSDSGNIYEGKQLYLPAGRKPLIITQTNINYYTYMLDGDGDKLPDKDGDGFASRLVIDENGALACEMIMADGSVETGAYDLVPILESFIATHPDFSYKGARAILAVSGYDGLFGYRTGSKAAQDFSDAYRQSEREAIVPVIEKLRETGYEIGCYTYGNSPYGTTDISVIKEEIQKWNFEVSDILGPCDIFVYAKGSDITNTSTLYTGEKFNALYSAGFRYFLGFCNDGTPWTLCADTYVRQGRLIVNGDNLKNHPDWFNGIFDTASIIDATRNAE